jgi:hypothetical protein
MKGAGRLVSTVVWLFAAYLALKSVPDIIRYIKISRM